MSDKKNKVPQDVDLTPSKRAAAVLKAEAERLAAIVRKARVSGDVSPAIVAFAPARGAVKTYRHREAMITEAGGIVIRATTPATCRGLQILDAFDAMEHAALSRRKAGDDARPIFTVAQIVAGRTYAVLVERQSAGGMRCSDLEGSMGGAGDGGGFIDAYAAASVRLDRMRQRIGTGVALAPRRAAVSAGRCQPISDRHLIDSVAIKGWSLARVLDGKGWAPGGKNSAALRDALCAILDRLYGY